MGGKEGAWGYLAQAVVCVINSLVEKSWTHVQIEPDTANDKVDIAWFYESSNPEVVQVKSSKNNFTHSNILSWLQTLIQDVPDAVEYRLILIGTCSDTTKKIINRINENRATDDDWNGITLLKTYGEKIKIQLENNDQEALESKIMRYLGRFLSDKGKYPTHTILELMSKSLAYQFMRFSTNGEKISREAFENQLLDWVNYNYLLEGELRQSDLKIEYYLFDKIPFSTSMNAYSTSLSKSRFFLRKKEEAFALYEKIKEMVIIRKEREEQEHTNILGRSLRFPYYSYCEFTEKRKKNIIYLSREFLGVELNDEFFYVGNLKQPSVRVTPMFGSAYVETIGDKEEKVKYELLLKYEDKLEEIRSMLEMLSYLDSFYCIPLVLRNFGTKHDRNIRVKVKLPKNLRLLTANNMKQPDLNVIEYFTGFGSCLQKAFTHKKDSKIIPYSYRPYKILDNILYHLKYYNEEELIEEFRSYLKVLFDFEFYEEDGKYVLVFHFNEINPKETLAFPCFLLVQAGQSFEINYEITSQNLPNVANGVLTYQV